jgi:hypothetical protein
MNLHVKDALPDITSKRPISSVKDYFLPVVEGFQWLENLFMFPRPTQGLLMRK